jgi:hypothetical protein
MRERRTLAFESLEGKLLLSLPGATPPPADTEAEIQAMSFRSAAPRSLGLRGVVKGNFLVELGQTTSTTTFRGNGMFAGVGTARATASAQDSGQGLDFLDLVLSNRRGTVTVRIVSTATVTSTNPTTPMPGRFQIQSGTGAYAQSQGAGTIQMRILPRVAPQGVAGRFIIQFQPDKATA